MDASDIKRNRELTEENCKLKQLVGDQALAMQIMEETMKKKALLHFVWVTDLPA